MPSDFFIENPEAIGYSPLSQSIFGVSGGGGLLLGIIA